MNRFNALNYIKLKVVSNSLKTNTHILPKIKTDDVQLLKKYRELFLIEEEKKEKWGWYNEPKKME